MPIETELKLRVTDHAPVRQALRVCGATQVKRQHEINTFLDTPDDALMRGGSGLRVRSAKNLDTGDVEVIITHKGPRKPGPMKIRRETELAVSSHDNAVELLAQLGYEVKLSFEKRRETWELGDCEVVLDELPDQLGMFVEIEGDELAIPRVRQQLRLEQAPIEPETYAHIVRAHLKKTGKTQLRFEP